MIAAASGLARRYGAVEALSGVTIEIGAGVTGLVGVNGAGKSTLLNIAAGALAPTSGTFAMAGEGAVALMPQRFDPHPRMRLDDFLHYCCWLRALPRRTWVEQVGAVLERVDLSDRSTAKLGQLSGGMLRRANLAQALLGDPRLLLLDEPTEGLDPEQRAGVRKLIKRIGEEAAVVVSSHDMDDLGLIADRVLMLERGAIRFDGTVAEMTEIGERSPLAADGISVLEAAFLQLRQDVAA
ncbi:MAG: ATP-binding cassette domain-containing protein [Nocardioidaceae bacterium]|nr:ATP-binding cassette domain-containing protein [Nocardioidaceae bacterium]MCL2612521.1 ATP-binding cassette domain-containing protein [Nocardioidaceae bacterium]